MDARTLRFEREYELPRAIVWDALVDEDLVSGWLAEARIDGTPGGTFALNWIHREPRLETIGTIVALEEPGLLEIEFSASDPATAIRFELQPMGGGSRGSSTRLLVSLDVVVDRAFEASLKADWLTSLDQLEDLLRGHPVEWAHWERDRRSDWSMHLAESAGANGVEDSTA